MLVSVNYLAVLVCGLINMVLGMLWFSPVLFGKPWMAALGWNPAKMDEMKKTQKNMGAKYAIAALTGLVLAFVMSHFVYFVSASTFAQGMKTGLWLWLGFVATSGVNAVLWEKKPLKLYAIDVGYYLVDMMILGGVLSVWR